MLLLNQESISYFHFGLYVGTWSFVIFFFSKYHYRAAKDLEERRSHYEPSIGPGVPDDIDHPFGLEENDFVPHFQRVSISGEDTSGVSYTVYT